MKSEEIVTTDERREKTMKALLINIITFGLILIPWLAIRRRDARNHVGAYRYPLRVPDTLSTVLAYSIFIVGTFVDVFIIVAVANYITDTMTLLLTFSFGIVPPTILFFATAKMPKFQLPKRTKKTPSLDSGKRVEELIGNQYIKQSSEKANSSK